MSRKQNESVLIGENIVITILSVDRDQVRIGIEAPKDVRIMRQELYDAVREQNIIASHFNAEAKPELVQMLRVLLMGDSPQEDEENKSKK